MKDDCIFCKIAKGSIPSATVYEDRLFRVILDINPASKGHCLISTKEHFDNIYDLDGETAGRLFSLATCIARALRDALGCDGLNIVQNNGLIAGQTVFHCRNIIKDRCKIDCKRFCIRRIAIFSPAETGQCRLVTLIRQQRGRNHS